MQACEKLKTTIRNAVVCDDRSQLPAIEVTMLHPDPDLRETAVWAYAVMLGKDALGKLRELAVDQDQRIREMAQEAIVWLEPAEQR